MCTIRCPKNSNKAKEKRKERRKEKRKKREKRGKETNKQTKRLSSCTLLKYSTVCSPALLHGHCTQLIKLSSQALNHVVVL